jgi:hypothetical protein
LLDEIISARRTNTPGRRALYNNLNTPGISRFGVDAAVRKLHPDDWRGIQPRENTTKQAAKGIPTPPTSRHHRRKQIPPRSYPFSSDSSVAKMSFALIDDKIYS